MNVERNNIGWYGRSIHHILHTIFTPDGDVYNCLSKIILNIIQTYHHHIFIIFIFLHILHTILMLDEDVYNCTSRVILIIRQKYH